MEEPFFERFKAAGKGQAKRFASYDGDKLRRRPEGDAIASEQAGLPTTQFKLLAEAIPAVSFAAAANSLNVLDEQPGGERNIDMEDERVGGQWPQVRLEDELLADNWLHSDIKNIAYPYIEPLYERIVLEGGLR